MLQSIDYRESSFFSIFALNVSDLAFFCCERRAFQAKRRFLTSKNVKKSQRYVNNCF
jgi:hypothetical protein